MDGYKSLTHSRYDGKYHVVICPEGEEEKPLWENQEVSEGSVSRAGKAEGLRDNIGA